MQISSATNNRLMQLSTQSSQQIFSSMARSVARQEQAKEAIVTSAVDAIQASLQQSHLQATFLDKMAGRVDTWA